MASSVSNLKRIIIISSIVLLTHFFTATPVHAIVTGDVNGDDTVNSTDALIVLSCDVGMDTSQFCPMNCGDVNADGLINSTDALIILSYDVGMSVPFPVGEAGCPSSVTQCPGCTVTARRPNILLIIGDDIGLDVTTDLYQGLIDSLAAKYDDRVRGHPASLPVLKDRLASQGMVFSNVWAQPYCSPTRATIMTGLFEKKTNVQGVMADDSRMMTTHTTVAQKLKEAGYSTAMIGKWHIGGNTPGTTGASPKQAGFDYYRGNNAAFIPAYWSYPVNWQDSTTPANTVNTTTAASVIARSLPAGTTPAIASTKYAPVVKGWDTIDWINARTTENPDKPWFVWLAFNVSHVTVQTPNMHVPNKDTLDSNTIAEIDGCLGSTGQYGSDSIGANNPQVGNCTGKQLMRAMTNAMDTVIGKILDKVESLDSDTYVIFIGDNGTPMYGGTYGLQIDNMYITQTTGRGKGSAWEAGCHVPMAIMGPNIDAGGQNDSPVHVVDLFATILTLAGVTPPTQNLDYLGNPVDSDSKTLTPILFGSANNTGRDPNYGYILTETHETSFGTRWLGARNATYKVLCPYSLSSYNNCDFYDLVSDPLEEDDPITDPLLKPASCTDYDITWTPPDPRWHFCRLMEVLNTYSILSP